jgi:hypothetical protein
MAKVAPFHPWVKQRRAVDIAARADGYLRLRSIAQTRNAPRRFDPRNMNRSWRT